MVNSSVNDADMQVLDTAEPSGDFTSHDNSCNCIRDCLNGRHSMNETKYHLSTYLSKAAFTAWCIMEIPRLGRLEQETLVFIIESLYF